MQGSDSATVLEDRGLLGPLVEASNQMDDIRDKVNATLKAQKQLTKETEKTNQKTKEIKQKTEGTTFAFDTAFNTANLFNASLGQTEIFMDSIKNGATSFSTELINAVSEADQLKEKFMEIGQGIEQGIVSNLTNAVMGTQTLAQAAIGVLNDLKRKLVEVAMQRAVSGIGNFFGNALSGIFGGGKTSNYSDAFKTSFDTSLLRFANGGRPPLGRASIVGERGPELFVPRTAGTIIPNNEIGGGNTTNNMITVNVDATGSSVQGNGSEADQLGGLIASVVQATIIDEQRAGGLLNR